MARTVPILALSVLLVLALGSCGGGGGGGGQTTSAPSAKTAGGGTTAAPTTKEGTVPTNMTSSTVNLTPSQDSGVTGTATLTNTSSGVQVVLNMQNLPGGQPGTEHLAHIHQGGTCADDRAGNGAPVEYPLTSVMTAQDGTGTSTTDIPGVSVAELLAGPSKYINVHAEQTGSETPPGISCADLSTRQD